MQEELGIQKVAALMIAMGEDTTSNLMSYMSDDELNDLSRQIALTKVVPPERLDRIIEEFYNMILAKKFIAKGGLDYAKMVLIKSLGPERARKIIDRLSKVIEQSTGFEFLSKVDPKQLSKFIINEHPQTIALILAHLEPGQAASALSQMTDDLKAEVSLRVASLQDISPSVVRTLSTVLEERFEALSSYNVEVGGVKSVAEMFNRMDRTTSKTTLGIIERNSPDLAIKIRDLMFVFDDIKGFPPVAIQEILKRVDKEVLAMSLKGSDEKVKNTFFGSMSKRAVETMQEEMGYMGAVRLRDVEQAQHEVVSIVRELDEAGTISISAGEEETVV